MDLKDAFKKTLRFLVSLSEKHTKKYIIGKNKLHPNQLKIEITYIVRNQGKGLEINK